MYIRKVLLFILVIVLTFGMPSHANEAAPPTPAQNDLRGVWVATAANADYPQKPTINPEVLKAEAVKILDNAKKIGLNTIIIQVRPAADAIYPSKYFPWSRFLTGGEGLQPEQGFDPLAFWVEQAHLRDMALHAWITPFRVTKKASSEPDHHFSSLAPSNPAKIHQDWVIRHSDGNLYFNPGIPEVRKLILDSTLEIIHEYDIDGIHFDGFFYPGKSFQDQSTYMQHRKGNESIENWRRNNVNSLISEVSAAIKASGKNIRFGISPFGIWANRSSNALGSATAGQESYHHQYADSLQWIQNETIDYIAPQVFWNIGYTIADYKKLSEWWINAVSGTNVDLYIGHAAYKAGNKDLKSPWYGTAEIERQLIYNRCTPEIKGSILSSSSSLLKNAALSEAIRTLYQNPDQYRVEIPVSLSRPLEDLRTSYSRFYLNGASDPEKPLYLNGEPVTNRSKQGYFGVLVPLSEGANTFTVTQGTSQDTRTVYRTTSEPLKPMDSADIIKSSVFPQSQEYRSPGEKITLSCKAPVGSEVTVDINGQKLKMVSGKSDYRSGLYPVTYTCTYTLPSFTGAPRVVDLGAPVYTMNYKGNVITRKAPAHIGVIMEGAPYYANVAGDMIYTYAVPNTDGGGVHELYGGMVDFITGMTGNYARLSTGQYVKKSAVKISSERTEKPIIKSSEYITGEKWDVLKLNIEASPASYITSDGKIFNIHISAGSTSKQPVLPDNRLFSSIEMSAKKNTTQYTLSLKESRNIEGYYMEKTADGLEIHFKHRIYAKEGEKPLSGITIMVDPGHGGSETGAIGPLGLDYAEKDMNLDNSFKLKAELESLGAKVLMTRTTDIDLSLNDRLAASKNAMPDMFISIHSNSMPDNVDISEYFGFSTYYREAHARFISEEMLDYVTTTLNRKNRGIHVKNFYVIRGTWTPSLLIECGFVPNPVEFEWLTDEREQQKLMKTIAESIVRYFSQ